MRLFGTLQIEQNYVYQNQNYHSFILNKMEINETIQTKEEQKQYLSISNVSISNLSVDGNEKLLIILGNFINYSSLVICNFGSILSLNAISVSSQNISCPIPSYFNALHLHFWLSLSSSNIKSNIIEISFNFISLMDNDNLINTINKTNGNIISIEWCSNNFCSHYGFTLFLSTNFESNNTIQNNKIYPKIFNQSLNRDYNKNNITIFGKFLIQIQNILFLLTFI